MKNFALILLVSIFLLTCKKKQENCSCYVALNPSDTTLLGHHAHEKVYFKSNYDSVITVQFSYIDHYRYYDVPPEGCAPKEYYSIEGWFPNEFYRKVTICKDAFRIQVLSPDLKWNKNKSTTIDFFQNYNTESTKTDTLRVDNQLLSNVYIFDDCDTLTNPIRKFYFSQEKGLLKVVMRYGVTWERINL